MEPKSRLPAMRWGAAPELVGPRHDYRTRRLAARLRKAVPSGRILDAGCGAGTLTELLARLGYRVTAVEASTELVDYTRERLSRAGLADRVEIHRGDLEAAHLPAEAFDGAVCGEVLEHLRDDAAAARAIAAALKHSGVLLLTVPAEPDRYDWLDRWAGHQRRYDEAAIRELMHGAGLNVETLTRWGFPFMALYERYLQRPGLARAAGAGRGGRVIARFARWAPVVLLAGALFSLDRHFEGHTVRGTGFLVQARRP